MVLGPRLDEVAATVGDHVDLRGLRAVALEDRPAHRGAPDCTRNEHAAYRGHRGGYRDVWLYRERNAQRVDGVGRDGPRHGGGCRARVADQPATGADGLEPRSRTRVALASARRWQRVVAAVP